MQVLHPCYLLEPGGKKKAVRPYTIVNTQRRGIRGRMANLMEPWKLDVRGNTEGGMENGNVGIYTKVKTIVC